MRLALCEAHKQYRRITERTQERGGENPERERGEARRGGEAGGYNLPSIEGERAMARGGEMPTRGEARGSRVKKMARLALFLILPLGACEILRLKPELYSSVLSPVTKEGEYPCEYSPYA